jgi:hypothetical protein
MVFGFLLQAKCSVKYFIKGRLNLKVVEGSSKDDMYAYNMFFEKLLSFDLFVIV